MLPPQAGGAPTLLLVKTPLQPPEAVAVASHVAKAASTADCVWQAAAVVFIGHVRVIEGGGETVKVAIQLSPPGSSSKT